MMSSAELDNLVRVGALKTEQSNQSEFDGLVKSGIARLNDAANPALALESRFDLAYNAAHALSLAALRWHGYRSDKRYIVFQTPQHTIGMPAAIWRVLDRAHQLRNLAEYEGEVEIDERILADLLCAAEHVGDAVVRLGPVRPAPTKAS
jgi:hypothetical protein